MPIDDIDYLLEHSVEENIIILVDSRQRNRAVFPSSAEFEITFNEPFRFVKGIEILNTSIPRTLFMVDEHNNRLIIRSLLGPIKSQNQSVLALLNDSCEPIVNTILPQDFQSASEFFNIFNDQIDLKVFQLDNFEEKYVSDNVIHKRSKADFPVPRLRADISPFLIDNTTSTMRHILGFPNPPQRADFEKYTGIRDLYSNRGMICSNATRYNLADAFVRPDRGVGYDAVNVTHQSVTIETSDIATEIRESFTPNAVSFMINASYRHVPTVGTNTFLSNLLLQFDVDISQYVFQSTCTMTRFVSDNSEERRLLNKLPMMLNGPDYRIDPNTYIHATEGIRLKSGEHYRLQFEMTITEHMVHTVRTALSRVRVSYGLFLRANPALGSESLVSVPIVNEEYFQNGEPQRFELNTSYLNTSTEPRRLLIIGDPDMKFDGDYPAFVLPTNIADSVQHVYDFNSICTYFEVAIPVLTEQADFINTDLEMFFADVYEGGELIARMHFDARIVNNTLRLVFSAQNTKLEVLNMLHLNIGLMRLQKNDTEYIPQLSYYLYHVGGQIPISLDKFDVISHYAPIQCFIVNSPGMINLATESYLTLRCEEIENHIRGSYNTKEHSPGLGIVNIDVQGYAVDRVDFFSVKYKQFHPIGQLHKLKFRFERCSDGELYNFRNVDLHFLLSIKFLRPKQREKILNSVLNPEYNPDFVGYINKSMQAIEDHSTDEDDDEYFENDIQGFESSDDD